MAAERLDKVLVFGATSAIAQSVVRLLAERRASLVLFGRNLERLEAVAADARMRGAALAEVVAADLNEVARHDELLRRGFASLGTVDLVLLAQGVLADSDSCEADPSKIALQIQSNFAAPAQLAQAAALRLATQGSGTVAAISSVAGDRGRQSNYAYGSAKGGLSLFLAGLRNRMFKRNVHVVTVLPGFVDTPMTAQVKKNGLFVEPARVALAIVRAVERRRDVVYVPGFWRLIMLVIKSVPEALFKRLSL